MCLLTGQAVICYNLKTSNILLTESYRAKVCCSILSESGYVMPASGAVGYSDPEYLRTFELTAKSDVYSFGIILLEILSSHGPQDWNVLMNHQNSSSWTMERVVQWVSFKPDQIAVKYWLLRIILVV
jgi:serine/threonine protein kinase